MPTSADTPPDPAQRIADLAERRRTRTHSMIAGTKRPKGFPGVEGARVVRVGDVVAGPRVLRIDGGRVTVLGVDTT